MIYTLEKTIPITPIITPKVTEVNRLFGLGENPIKILEKTQIEIKQGQIVYITGGSGVGKSTILNMLKVQIPDAVGLKQSSRLNALVDCFDADLNDTLLWLSTASLSDTTVITRYPKHLSDGQRYQFRLALTLESVKVICLDNFCDILDRITAAVIAHNIRRFADRFNVTFIVATSHDDLLSDLDPDVVVTKHFGSKCDIYYPKGIKNDL